jgi:hypothetical protein
MADSENNLRRRGVRSLAAGLIGEFYSEAGEPNAGETANLLRLAEVSIGWAEGFETNRDHTQKNMKEMKELISRTASGLPTEANVKTVLLQRATFGASLLAKMLRS